MSIEAVLVDADRAQKARLRRVDVDTLPYFNRLVDNEISMPIGDDAWRLIFSRPGEEAGTSANLVASWHVLWDDCAVVVAMSMEALRFLFESCGCQCPYAALPKHVALAVGQTVLERASQALQKEGASPLRLERIDIGEAYQAQDRYPIAWQAGRHSDEARLQGLLWTDLTGLDRMTSLLGESSPAMESWSDLTIPLTFEIGYTTLPLGQLRSLRVGDVVLADKCWSDQRGQLIAIRIDDRLLLQGEIGADGTVTARSGVMSMKREEGTMPDADVTTLVGASMEDFESLPINLSFDLGERSLKLSELSTLQPGHVFDLGLLASQAVTMRANGVRIGEGELVEIDGRIGVAVTRIAPPHASQVSQS